MPKNFKFYVDHALTFRCQLQSHRCESNNNNGRRCGNKSVIGTPVCWRHLLKHYHVRIKESQYGKGLFAMDTTKDDNAVIFKRNDTIVQYEGEILNRNELNNRYGRRTAPYAVQQADDRYIDSACHRGVGSLINHAPEAQSNCRFSYGRNNNIQVKATKNIRNNRELFLNYNKGVRRNEQRYLFNEEGVNHTTT